MPVISLILIYKGFKQEEESKLRNYFLILYQGLKPKAIYWEYINTLRKILLLCSLLLPKSISVFVSLIVLVSSARIEVFIKPYKNPDHYKVEFLAMMAGAATISTSLIYSQKVHNDNLDTILFVIMILINLKFILEWLYLICKSYEDKNTC